MTMILDGSAGVTFPNSTVQASAGSVLQVVNATSISQTSTSSSSLSATGMSLSITPKFTTSKVLVVCTLSVGTATNASSVGSALFRNGSNILTLGNYTFYLAMPTSITQINGQITFSYLDSPASTSVVTYAPYYSSPSSNLVYFCLNNSLSSITLMEIAG